MTTEDTIAPTFTPCDLSADDLFMTLTGFDEIAILKEFGADIVELKARPMMFLRALVFVWLRRCGQADRVAFKTAQTMPISEVTEVFPQGDPVEESGK